MPPSATPSHFHPIHYDAQRRRLWVLGQRCHHGATGAMLAGVATAALMAARITARTMIAVTAAAGLMMAHDWKDRAVWFERGRGSQP
jgi:hypothetical protein